MPSSYIVTLHALFEKKHEDLPFVQLHIIFRPSVSVISLNCYIVTIYSVHAAISKEKTSFELSPIVEG